MIYSRVEGTGRYLPERILTNADLENMVDTSDEWIKSRTGVERRHVAADDECTSDLCVAAAKVAMESAGVTPDDLTIGTEVELVIDTLYEDDEHEYMVWKWRPLDVPSEPG